MPEEITGSKMIPLLPVRDLVLFPGVIVPLFVGRLRSLRALEEAMLHDRTVLVVAQKDTTVEDPEPEDIFGVGTVTNVMQMLRLPDGTTKVLVEGASRASIVEVHLERDSFFAKIEPLEPVLLPRGTEIEALRRTVLAQFDKYVTIHPKIPLEVLMSVASLDDPGQVADLVASHLTVRIPERQHLLEAVEINQRLEMILKILLREIELLEMERSIHERVRQELEKGQKEYYLREQLKVIQDELGQGDDFSELDTFREEITKSRMPEDVRKKALHELDRLAKMPQMSAEATVVRTYLDWLTDLPWRKKTKESMDITLSAKVLDEDHYALDEAKERILEYLAVRKQAGNKLKGQVLCFTGPPGVGKTSLGRSIARATGRKFVNMSLGGIRDEAEIRGHRRTYIGALPGRIIQKIRQAGTCNPVMLLDEIDKIGLDFRGDPASALLEVLDPEQNSMFTDHFLEVPFDLGNVLFITTANSTHTIPKPLLDRMEVIRLPGYVSEEKVHIARRHLIPKVLDEHGLAPGQISFTPASLNRIITEYTREAGVRELERQISKVVRKITRKIVESEEKNDSTLRKTFRVGTSEMVPLLGVPRHHGGIHLPSTNQKGAAIGLAWTETGGDILVIESVRIAGKGRIILTGNLGEIMQESGQTALGYLKANSEELGISSVEWDKTDIHVHVPEGAIPKDGPSAGITLAVSIYSALSGKLVRNGMAMTGEVTLRGDVLPVGGIREKILAARRYGVGTVLLPMDNRLETSEMPHWVLKGLDLVFVRKLEEVFGYAIEQEKSDAAG
ncbi:MAG: endopeptidase La [Thermovirgaceae bacterium]|nr:endopeptidase La [Thermovirgaceae bacterium]